MTNDNGPLEDDQSDHPPLGVPPLGWSGEPIMIVFFIALEQPMAVPDRTSLFLTRYDEPMEWVEWNGGFNFVGIRLHRRSETVEYRWGPVNNAFDVFKRETGYLAGPAPEGVTFGRVPPPQADVLGTVVEAATALVPSPDGDSMMAVSNAFDRCLQELQFLMQAYFLVTHDVRFRPISRQTCEPLVPMATQGLDGAWSGWGIFHVHFGEGQLPYAPEELDAEHLDHLEVTLHRNRRGDPMAPFIERARVARRSYRVDGDYATTVIACYTACEVFLNAVLLLMAWEEGTARADTRGWFEGEMGFMSRVGAQITPRLGGNWGTQDPDSAMNRLRRLADQRHRVVHYGHLPEEREAQQAFDALEALEQFVKARLGNKRKTYLRTALLVLGMPGFRRLGLWNRWMERFVESNARQEPDWIVSYRHWLDTQ